MGLSEGVPIQRVHVHLRNPLEVLPEGFQDSVIESLGLWAGDPFNFILADEGLQRIRQTPEVAEAEYRLYQGDIPGQVIVAVLLLLRDSGAAPEASPAPDPGFPVLHQDEASKLQLIVNGAWGAYSENNPWFGDSRAFLGPTAPFGSPLSWGEGHLETGLGGITRLGDHPAWLYGAGTYLTSASGSDIFNSRARSWGAIERLYGGLLVADKDSPVTFNLSAGRQHFQLNRNYLFGYVRGSANAQERAGSYLSSRITYQGTVLGKVRSGPFSLQGFYLNPDELPNSDNDTRYLGANLAYNDNESVEASLAVVTSPQSRAPYLLPAGQRQTREGLWVINPRLRLTSLFGVEGLWLETEYAHQGNSRFPMSADAGYGWIGYTTPGKGWKPGAAYRFAYFSGDDPNTPTYERFDPLQSGGLGTWLQGISMAKVFPNSNLVTHNLNFRVWPSEDLEVILDWFHLSSAQLNNLGGARPLSQLTSHDLGQEFQLTAQHYISQNLFLLGVTSVAVPGTALRDALNRPRPWFTLQLSLFMTL